MPNVGNKLIQLFFALYTPDRKHVVVLCLKRVGCPRICDKTAGKRFHGNESHIFFFTFFHQRNILIAREIAERELQSLIKTGFDRLIRHRKSVIRDPDMADHSFFFRFKHCLVKPASISGLRTDCWIVELIDVHIICPQIVQGSLQLFEKFFCIGCGGLGRHKDLIPDTL